MPGAVLLFDVDGTLVSAGGAGRRALERALGGVCGMDGAAALAAIRFDGMTDRAIVRAACRAAGRDFSIDECRRVLDEYVELLPTELGSCPFAVLPGAAALLDELATAGASVGLATGNVEAGARAKLARGNIAEQFEFGGFGEDGETREEILLAAIRRAGDRRGARVAPAEVMVIGDTPRDVDAALAVGCRALAVATGHFGIRELRATGAHHAFGSLAEPAVRAVLIGASTAPAP